MRVVQVAGGRPTYRKTYLCSPCDGCNLKDSTGSYHISISLSYDTDGWVAYDDTILDETGGCSGEYERRHQDGDPMDAWVKAHSNLVNMIQWVEPPIVAVFGSFDTDSAFGKGRFVEGSYRTMDSGWGVPGTTDVRTFGDVGTGRYSSEGFEWMLDVIPQSRRGLLGCSGEGTGSDIRTKTSTNEHEMSHGDTPLPMEVDQGIEIRVLDNFQLEDLKTVYRLVALVAEAGRHHTAESYVYDDAGWVLSAQESILEGWNSILSPDYIDSLAYNLGIDLECLGGNTQAFEVFKEMYYQLHQKHASGIWTRLLLDDTGFDKVETLGNPNRENWEVAARHSYPSVVHGSPLEPGNKRSGAVPGRGRSNSRKSAHVQLFPDQGSRSEHLGDNGDQQQHQPGSTLRKHPRGRPGNGRLGEDYAGDLQQGFERR